MGASRASKNILRKSKGIAAEVLAFPAKAYYGRKQKKYDQITEDIKFVRDTKNYNPPSSGGKLTDFDKQVLNARFNVRWFKRKNK